MLPVGGSNVGMLATRTDPASSKALSCGSSNSYRSAGFADFRKFDGFRHGAR